LKFIKYEKKKNKNKKVMTIFMWSQYRRISILVSKGKFVPMRGGGNQTGNDPQILFDIKIHFCTLDHAFSNYDERKTNEIHFQSKPYI
jgi:hypothetical protein